jgi:uncharacterized membrane protein YfcA
LSSIFTRYILALFFIALPGMIAGFTLGSRVAKKVSEAIIRRVIITMLMLGGVSILSKSLIWRTQWINSRLFAWHLFLCFS